MPINESPKERVDRYVYDFIANHTKFEIDGKAYKALAKSFDAFEIEVRELDAAEINAAKANERVFHHFSF